MRRIIIISVIALFVIVGGAFAYIFTQANSIIAELKPEIETQGGAAIGSKMELGNISLTFFPETALAIDGVTLTDPEDPKKQLSMKAGRVQVGLFALLSGNVKVDSITLVEPAIHIHQTKDGVQIYGMASPAQGKQQKSEKPKKKNASGGQGDKASAQSKPAAQGGLPSWLSVNLDSISIKDGAITFQPIKGESMRLNAINLQTGFTLEGQRAAVAGLSVSGQLEGKGPISLELTQGSAHLESLRGSLKSLVLKAALEKEKINITSEVSGISFDGKTASADIQSMKGSASLPSVTEDVDFQLQKISYQSSGAQLGSGSVTTAVKELGKITAKFAGIEVALPSQRITLGSVDLALLGGTAALKGDYTMSSQSGDISFVLKDLEYAGEKVSGEGAIMARNGEFVLQRGDFGIFGASIQASGKGKPFTEQIPFMSKIAAKNLDIGRAVSVAMPNQEPLLTGTLVRLDAETKGTAKPDPKKTLQASSSFEIKDGVFTGGNLPALVLKAMKDIPFLNQAVFGSVPQEYQDELDGDSTPIRSLTADIAIQNEVISVKSLALQSTIFSLDANGSIGFDQKMNLETTFRFAPAFSLALAGKVGELKKLIDEKDRLVIPLQLTGKATSPIVLPNMKEIMKLGAGEVIKEKAADLLGKAFGKKSSTPSGGTAPGTESEKSKEQKIVEGVGSLFGF